MPDQPEKPQSKLEKTAAFVVLHWFEGLVSLVTIAIVAWVLMEKAEFQKGIEWITGLWAAAGLKAKLANQDQQVDAHATEIKKRLDEQDEKFDGWAKWQAMKDEGKTSEANAAEHSFKRTAESIANEQARRQGS